MSNNKKYLFLSIALVLLTFMGVSLAYFLTSIEEERSDVRPVISLNSCVKVTGTGIPDNPYVVDYDGSCS